MTDDTHGTPPHDPENQDSFEHEQQQPAVEAETWHGGAPEDDFKDPAHDVAAEAEESATVYEEPDATPIESHESFETEETVEPVKKRSILLPVIVTIGGILLLGVLAYWQFGDTMHGDQQPTVAMQMATPKLPAMEPAAPKQQAAENPPVSVAPKSDMAPIANNTEPVMPAPVAPVQVTMPMQVAPAPAPTPAPTTIVVQAAPPAPASTVNSGTDARITALSAQVDELKKALSDATQQLSQLSTKLSSAPTPAAPAPQQSTLAIEERINGIEQKLMQMEHAPVAPAAAPVVVAASEAPAASLNEAPVVTEPSFAPVVHRTHHKTVHHKTVAKKKHVSKPAKPVEQTRWVLRAASPEEAWVAKNQITSDLQPVQVGDSLAGIGKVTAIRDENGVWVIVGTKGSIR